MNNKKIAMKNLPIFVLALFGTLGSPIVAGSKNVLRVKSSVGDSKNDLANLEYDTVEEDVIPLLTRARTLIAGAIEAIDDGACRDQCKLVIDGLHNLTTWSVKFYDSSGKVPEGVLAGSIYQLGNFDECLKIGRSAEDETPIGLRAQYCLGEVDIDVPANYLKRRASIWKHFREPTERYDETINKLYWGICFPSACTNRDVEGVIERVLEVAFVNSRVRVGFKIPDGQCYKNEPLVVDTLDVVYMSIISVVASIICVGTILHMAYLRNKNETPRGIVPQIFIAFSLISNVKKLCGPANDDGLNLDCISGIKFIVMMFIIAGHTLVFVIGGPILNSTFWVEATGKVENSVFLNNPLLVDTFLFLSGFLFCRLILRELDKRKSVNFIFLYVFRYIRLTPAYMVIVGLYLTWLPKLDSGPLWSRMDQEKERCRVSWWANILYINNYVDTDQLCMFQSWYLSVDTQLFVLAPAIIYPLWKWRRPGEFILAGVTAVSMLVPFMVTLLNQLDPTLMIYPREVENLSTNEYFKNIYIKTHMRASAYFFGLVYGYILYRIQTSNYRLSANTVRGGWIVASLSLIAGMFSITVFYGPRKNFTTIEAAVYSPLHRALWSAGTGWVLLACITDNAGPLKNFLKWRPFVPLSRLTYSAYLVNGLVELHSVSTARTPQHLDYVALVGKVLSHIVLTFGGAAILSTMFESPILGLERIFLRSESAAAKSLKKIQNEETTTTEA